MVDRIHPFQKPDASRKEEATSHLKETAERLVEGFDVQHLTRRIEEFGRANPFGLAISALVVGVAAGILMKNSKEFDFR